MKLRIVMIFFAVVLQLAATTLVFADSPVITTEDTLQNVLEGYKGKQVTIRLQGGEELTGKVKYSSKHLLHLEALSGREFFDALIDVSRIDAVIVRTK